MWVIVGRTQCNFCDTAKAILKGKGIYYVTYNVDDKSSRWILHLLKRSNLTTVPQIFDNNGNHIGGYTDLIAHLNSASGNGTASTQT